MHIVQFKNCNFAHSGRKRAAEPTDRTAAAAAAGAADAAASPAPKRRSSKRVNFETEPAVIQVRLCFTIIAFFSQIDESCSVWLLGKYGFLLGRKKTVIPAEVDTDKNYKNYSKKVKDTRRLKKIREKKRNFKKG